MEEQKVQTAPVRKPGGGVWLTHKHLGGIGIVGALLAIAPVKEFFFTREEGQSLTVQIAQMRSDESAHFTEVIRRQERLTDKVIERIKDAEERTVKNEDRLEARVNTLEASVMTKHKSARD